MSTFSTMVLERGAVTHGDLEASIANQVLYGGDLGTNMVELGVLRENALQRLLSGYYEIPVGPQGKLPPLTPEVKQLVPAALMRRYRIYPFKRTRRTLHVAVNEPLAPGIESDLRGAVGLQLRPALVTSLRLSEGLARECGLQMTERQRLLVRQLNAGGLPDRQVWLDELGDDEEPLSSGAAYRRMSERPSGIVQSERQSRRGRAIPLDGPPPDTLDGVGQEVEPVREVKTLEPGDPNLIETAPPASDSDDGFLDGERITQPYADDGEVEQKRDTQPWRDEDPDDVPLSVAGEFRASLSDAPPSDEAKIHEEHRRFRHRGPFTRAQAELAVSQATDVHMVLEILVRYARQFFERSVLLSVSGNSAELRLAHGLTMSLAMLTVDLNRPSVFREAHETGDPVVRQLGYDGVDAQLRVKLSVNGDQPVTVIPLSIRERVVALFYGDDRNDGVDADAVDDVTDFTEICAGEVTRLIIVRKRDSLQPWGKTPRSHRPRGASARVVLATGERYFASFKARSISFLNFGKGCAPLKK